MAGDYAPEEVYFWVGHPATEESTSCGIRTLDKLAALFVEIAAHYGPIVEVIELDDLPAVQTVATAKGYRIALMNRTDVDVVCSQEEISEWVAGAW